MSDFDLGKVEQALSFLFNTISRLVVSKIAKGVREEKISIRLCDLLNEDDEISHLLRKEVSFLNEFLHDIDLDLAIESTTHNPQFEGDTSQADIGIVLRFLRRSVVIREKALLLQAKKMLSGSEPRSSYDKMAEFKRKQLEDMQKINREYAGNSGKSDGRPCFYLLYKNIDGIWDEFEMVLNLRDEMAEWFLTDAKDSELNDDDSEEQGERSIELRNYVGQLALLVCDPDVIEDLDNSQEPITLGNIMRNRAGDPLVSLSKFVSHYFLLCLKGSTDPRVLNVAKGIADWEGRNRRGAEPLGRITITLNRQ